MQDRQESALISALETLQSLGVPPNDLLQDFDVGSTAYLNVLEEELLEDMVSHGAATCRFVMGPYGSGKTHLLGLMRERALDRGMVVASAELKSGMNLEEWNQLTAFVLQRMQMQTDSGIVAGLPAILASVGERNPDLDRVRGLAVPHASFKEAMRLALRPKGLSSEGLLWLTRFLEGQRVTATKLRQAGIRTVKDPLSARNAEHVLNTVVMTLFTLGVPGTLLTFDESETALQSSRHSPSLRLRQAANLMRRLIDACPTGRVFGVLAVFAVLPDFIQRTNEAYAALGQRLYTPLTEAQLPWRSPVVRVDDIGSIQVPEEFMQRLADRYLELVAAVRRGGRDRLRSRLVREGQEVLRGHVGSGYRRPLVKRLAAATLNWLEDAPTS